MSFSDFFMQSRLQAIESTVQQLCLYLDQVQSSQQLLSTTTLLNQVHAPPLLSQNDTSMFCIWTFCSVIVKILLFIGVGVICLFDIFRSNVNKVSNDVFYEVLIDQQLMNEQPNNKDTDNKISML